MTLGCWGLRHWFRFTNSRRRKNQHFRLSGTHLYRLLPMIDECAILGEHVIKDRSHFVRISSSSRCKTALARSKMQSRMARPELKWSMCIPDMGIAHPTYLRLFPFLETSDVSVVLLQLLHSRSIVFVRNTGTAFCGFPLEVCLINLTHFSQKI